METRDLVRYWEETAPMRRVFYSNPALQEEITERFAEMYPGISIESLLFMAFTGSCRDEPFNCLRCELGVLIQKMG